MTTMPMNQLAFSVNDIPRSMRWYEDVLGLLFSGGAAFDMPEIADIQGLPVSVSQVEWLVDKQENFQIEVFHWDDPVPRSWPERRLNDTGYNLMSFHVDDFEATLERARVAGSAPLTDTVGAAGERRVCVRDPDGILVEIMEDDPREGDGRGRVRPQVPSVLRSVTLAVPELARARRFWVDTAGLSEASGVRIHGPEHEALWGLEGSSRATLLLAAGDLFIEVVHYSDPTGKPWPEGYLKSDIGIINLALGGPDRDAYDAVTARTRDAGYHLNFEFVQETVKAVYVDDDQDFSVEMLFMTPETAAGFGYAPVER